MEVKHIEIGSDHAGFALKGALIAHLKKAGFQVTDEGAYSEESCDYPDYARKVCGKVVSGEGNTLGILVCGTGIGMSITANKVNGIRAALCHSAFDAEMTRRHNNANVLCLGARTTEEALALEIADIFLKTDFEGGRHAGRVAKIMETECRC